MKLEYILEFSDFLEYMLYSSSKSKLHKKSRKNVKLIVPIFYIVFAIILLYVERIELAIVFSVIALLWLLLVPLYTKWRSKKHFENHIREHYTNRFGKKVTLNLDKNADFIETYDLGTHTKIHNSEFDKLIELQNFYFLKLKTGMFIIIPKRAVSEHENFKKLFSYLDLEYVDELNWEWN